MQLKAAIALMRFDKPIGMALLWWPTAWALWIANQGSPALDLFFYFLIGTILMRAAGCVMNDMADRHIDPHVARTRFRPLASGEIDLKQALFWLIGLLCASFLILLQLPVICFYYAWPALLLALTYPFFKRFFPTPQAVLSLAFSMGILMVYAASSRPMDVIMWIVVVNNIVWVLAYDTLYAAVDQSDDEVLDVHSTARYWGKWTKAVVMGLQVVMQGGWLIVMGYLGLGWPFLIGWLMASVNVLKQWRLWLTPDKANWFQAFKLNGWYGFWIWAGLYFSFLLSS